MEGAAVGKVHFDAAQGRTHADVQLDHRPGGIGLLFLGVVVAGAPLDLADARQRALDRMGVGIVDGQVEAHPGLAVTLEALDIASAQRGGLGAGIQLGSELDVEVGEGGVLVEAIDGLVGGETQAGQKEQAIQQG
ncbi:hypothetical protein D9M69_496810 [compost metagenome]